MPRGTPRYASQVPQRSRHHCSTLRPTTSTLYKYGRSSPRVVICSSIASAHGSRKVNDVNEVNRLGASMPGPVTLLGTHTPPHGRQRGSSLSRGARPHVPRFHAPHAHEDVQKRPHSTTRDRQCHLFRPRTRDGSHLVTQRHNRRAHLAGAERIRRGSLLAKSEPNAACRV